MPTPSPSLFIRIDPKDVDQITECETPSALLERYAEMCGDVAASEVAIAAARAIYATDEVEIDDTPSVSIADDGVWVSAWVWVPNGDEDEIETTEAEDEIEATS